MKIELPSSIAANIKHFTGRTWLLPILSEWFEKSNERMFILTGDPGTGKSMISGWLAGSGPEPAEAETRQQLNRLRDWIKAVHFCVAASGTTDPKEVARQIANQLTQNVPGFGQALTDTMGDQVNIKSEQHFSSVEKGGSVTGIYIANLNMSGLSEELSFNRILRDPIKRLYEDGYDEPMLLLVDSLDEALTYTGTTNVVQLLAKLTDLPRQVRILVTTRDDPRVLRFFRSIKPIDLINNTDSDVNDLQTYIKERINQLVSIDETKRSDFAMLLAKQADGVFLYATIVLDKLLEFVPTELPDLKTYPLPHKLSGLYHDFLIRELNKDDQQWFDIYKSLLGLIAVAQGEGLSAEQLTNIIGKEIQEKLRACKQYLNGTIPYGPFKPFHKSFIEFLLEDKNNVDCHIDAVSMHKLITEHYLEKYQHDPSNVDEYGLNNLTLHLYQAKQFDELQNLISQEWMHTRYFKKNIFSYEGFLKDLDLAWQVTLNDSKYSEKGLVQGLRYALIRTSINSISASYHPAIVKRALEEELWSTERVFALAKNLHESNAVRMWAMILATDKLTDDERNLAEQLALKEAEVIIPASSRVDKYILLMKNLRDEGKQYLLQQGLKAIEEIKDTYNCSRAMSDLAHHLDGERKHLLLEKVLKLVPRQKDLWDDSENEWSKAYWIVEVASLLSDDLAKFALGLVQTFHTTDVRTWAEIALIPCFSGNERARMVEGVIKTIDTYIKLLIKDSQSAKGNFGIKLLELSELILKVSPFLNEDQRASLLRNALLLIRSSKLYKNYIHNFLIEIAPILTNDLLLEAIEIANRIANAGNRCETLAFLACRLPMEARMKLLEETQIALKSASGIECFRAYFGWATNSPAHSRVELQRAALDAAHIVIGESWDVEPIAIISANIKILLSNLDGNLVESALKLILDPKFLPYRKEMLELLAPRLSGAQIKSVLYAPPDDIATCAYTLKSLASHVVGAEREFILNYALNKIVKIEFPYSRIKFLKELAPYLDSNAKEKAVSQGIKDVKDCSIYSHLALEYLAPFLNENMVDMGIEIAREFNDPTFQTYGLAVLVSRIGGEKRQELIREVLSRIAKIDDFLYKAQILVKLVPYLEGKFLEDGLYEARQLKGLAKIETLIEIAPKFTNSARDQLISECYEEASIIVNLRNKVEALVLLKPWLSDTLRHKLVADTYKEILFISNESERVIMLARMVQLLNDTIKNSTIKECLERLSQLEEVQIVEVIKILSSHLREQALVQAIEIAEAIEGVKERADALKGLIIQLIAKSKEREDLTWLLSRIGKWLFSLRELRRGDLLLFTNCLFEQSILSEESFKEIAYLIHEIVEEWNFTL